MAATTRTTATKPRKTTAKKTVPAKVPAKDEPPVDDALTQKTVIVRDIPVTVTPDDLDDYELGKDLIAAQRGDHSKTFDVFQRLVGDQEQRIIEALREDTGRVRASTVGKFCGELLVALNPKS